jgi:hypothetical protein
MKPLVFFQLSSQQSTEATHMAMSGNPVVLKGEVPAALILDIA